MNLPLPRCMYPKSGNQCGQKWQGAIPSWGQDVTPRKYMSQMGPFLHPMSPPPSPGWKVDNFQRLSACGKVVPSTLTFPKVKGSKHWPLDPAFF